MRISEMENKFVGCLVGGAAGDALGYAVEFQDASSIFKKYGPDGITEYRLSNGVAEISDDTQMTLFTADGLLRATGEGDAISSVWGAYLDWYKTQSEGYRAGAAGLLGIPELYSCRAPGNTCLGALSSGFCGSLTEPINNSCGCGGIMRAAPVALWCYSKNIPRDRAAMLAAETAAITHGHPLGYIPTAVFSDIIRGVLCGLSPKEATEDAVRLMTELFGNTRHTEKISELLRRATVLSGEELDDLDVIRTLGEGWVAEQTLAIAVYCAIKYKNDFEKCIIAAANHSGDSDSTAAVAGNIVGAHLGAYRIPARLIKGLELAELTVKTAIRLARI